MSLSEWRKYFDLLNDVEEDRRVRFLLEINAGDSSQRCIFFNSEHNICSIHIFKPWLCKRTFCSRITESASYEEFYGKYGLDQIFFINEAKFNREMQLLSDVIELFISSDRDITRANRFLSRVSISMGLNLDDQDLELIERIMIHVSSNETHRLVPRDTSIKGGATYHDRVR